MGFRLRKRKSNISKKFLLESICICANTVRKPLSQARRGMSFAARGAGTSLMSINQGKRRKETKEMIENRNVNIITDADDENWS